MYDGKDVGKRQGTVKARRNIYKQYEETETNKIKIKKKNVESYYKPLLLLDAHWSFQKSLTDSQEARMSG